MKRIAVIGGGIAGVAAAYQLAQTPGVEPALFEASHRLGGIVETVTITGTHGDYIVECGPDAWVSEKTAARELAEELGLGSELMHSNDQVRRTYLAQPSAAGATELVPMPDGMRMMVPTRWEPVLSSPLFSAEARASYQHEPERADELRQFAAALPEDHDESVSTFVRRHFGEEATRSVAGPLLAGVFGGDIDKLSAAAVLAPFKRMEREHGSLVAATMERARAKQGEPEPVFTTVRPGLGELVRRMAAHLPHGAVRFGTHVTALAPEGDAGWRVESASTGDTEAEVNTGQARDPDYEQAQEHPAQGRSRSELFDQVLLATPAHITAELLRPFDAEAATLLPTHASSAVVVALMWEPPAAEHIRIPEGFGFLVTAELAQQDEESLLAGTFMHQKFAHRAPAGAVFLRGFFGGSAALRLQHAPQAQVIAAAHRAFARVLGPLPAAAHAVVRVWPRSLPQYEVGHPARNTRLFERVRAQHPGLHLIGNSYKGVGIPDLIAGAREAARQATA